MMREKKFFIFWIGAVTLVLLFIFIIALIFRPPKNNITVFSRSFIKDFSTYNATNGRDYNLRISKYIDNSYQTNFAELYNLSEDKTKIQTVEKGNYSKYLNSSVRIIEETKESAEVEIIFTAEKVDAPGRPTAFTETKTAEISIKKGNPNYINNFTFSTNE